MAGFGRVIAYLVCLISQLHTEFHANDSPQRWIKSNSTNLRDSYHRKLISMSLYRSKTSCCFRLSLRITDTFCLRVYL